MRSLTRQYVSLALALFAGALFAGCSGGAQGFGAPGSSSPTAHGQPQTSYSTIVGIKNDWIATIYGSGSAMCWSISPGLPSVGGFGQLSDPVTLTYTPLCPSAASTLAIQYGPVGTSTSADCTFNVTFNGTIFTYTVDQSPGTKCSVAPSADARYNEILTYAQIGPNAKRLKH